MITAADARKLYDAAIDAAGSEADRLIETTIRTGLKESIRDGARSFSLHRNMADSKAVQAAIRIKLRGAGFEVQDGDGGPIFAIVSF